MTLVLKSVSQFLTYRITFVPMSGVIARQSLWASLVNYTGSLIGLFTTFYLFPLVYSQTENGVIGLFIEMGALLAGVAQMGTGYSIWKFFPHFKNHEKKHNGAGFWIVIIPFFGFVITALALLFFKDSIMLYFGRNSKDFEPYYYWLLPFIFFFVFNNVFEIFSASIGKIIFASFLRENVVRVFLGLIGYLYYIKFLHFDQSVHLVPVVYGVVAVLNLTYILKNTNLSFIPDLHFVRNQENLTSEFSKYTGYLFLTYLANLFVQRIDFVMISSMKGFSDTGIYRIAVNMAVLIEIPTRSILQISNPKLAEAIHHNNHDEVARLYQKTSLNQFILGCLALLLIWINIDVFFQLMPNGEKYAVGKFAVLFLGIGKLLILIQGNSSAMLTFSKKYYWSLIVNICAVFLGILLNNYAIPKFGLEGAAIATACTWGISGLIVALLILKIYKMNPLTWNIFWVIILFAGLFGINQLWTNQFNIHFLIFGGLKTVVLMGTAMWVIYQFNLSDDVKSMMNKLIHRLKK